MPASSRDLYDPAIMTAQFVGDRVSSMSEKEVVAFGGKKIAQIRFELDDVAQLKALERLVKDDSLGKIFGDGEVVDSIAELRTVDVSFYKMDGGSGVSIAKVHGGENAMLALLSKADMDDLDLNPRHREPKAAEAAAPKTAKLTLGEGNTIEVQLTEKPAEPAARRSQMPVHRVAGGIAVPMGNPVALKAFLTKAWTSNSMSQPMESAEDMIHGTLMALSSESHPEDTVWPEGIKAFNALDEGKAIDSPARAVAIFRAAVEEREGPIVNRDDLVEQMRARKNKGPGA